MSTPDTRPIESPVVARTSAYGVLLGVVMLVGAVALVVLFFQEWSLALGGLTLPSWSLLVAGALAAGIGVVILLGARNAPHCQRCQRQLRSGVLPLGVQEDGEIERAVDERDAATLVALALPASAAPNYLLRVDYCPKCQQVALVTVGNQPRDQAAVFEGEAAAMLAEAASHRT